MRSNLEINYEYCLTTHAYTIIQTQMSTDENEINS